MSADVFEVPHVTSDNKKNEIYDAYRKLTDEYDALVERYDETLEELQKLTQGGELSPNARQERLMNIGVMAMHYVKLDNTARFHDDVVEVERVRGVLEEMIEEFEQKEAEAEGEGE